MGLRKRLSLWKNACTMSDKERFAEVLERFYFPPSAGDFSQPMLAAFSTLPAPLRPMAEALRVNLDAARTVASIPYTMTVIALNQRRFQALLMAQRIRSGMTTAPDFSSESERQAWAIRTAQEKLAEELAEDQQPHENSIDAFGNFGRAVLSDLLALSSEAELESSSDELLRQCTVLCWGALEVLSTDLFVTILNEYPSRTADLLSHPVAKKYFDPKAFGMLLAERQYDLSHCMGEVLVQQHRLDSVDAIRNIFEALFPGQKGLCAQLQDALFWTLGQDRNLIVHRRAMIDQQYVAKTGCQQAIGSLLRIGPNLLERYLTHVRDTGIELLRSASNTWL